MANEAGKRAAAQAAVGLIESGMTVGLGSGTTSRLFIEALGARVRAEHLQIRGVPTSRAAEAQARALGIPVVELTRNTVPDLAIDGADEVDPRLNLIKGGGGALVQEKLVAVSARDFVVIADSSKAVAVLGKFPLPVAIIPFGWETTLGRLEQEFVVPAARRLRDDQPLVTDDGMYLIDLQFGRIPDPEELENRLERIVGVIDIGLFIAIPSRVLYGYADGRVEEVRRPA